MPSPNPSYPQQFQVHTLIHEVHTYGGADTHIHTHDVHIPLQVTREGRPLPPSSYRFAFPVLSAVLSSPAHTPLHDEALAVVALHCSATLGDDIPRRQSLGLLYHALGVIPAYK